MVQRIWMSRSSAHTQQLLDWSDCKTPRLSFLPLDTPIRAPCHIHGVLQARLKYCERPSATFQGIKWLLDAHDGCQGNFTARFLNPRHFCIRPNRACLWHTGLAFLSRASLHLAIQGSLRLFRHTGRRLIIRIRIANEKPVPVSAFFPARSN